MFRLWKNIFTQLPKVKAKSSISKNRVNCTTLWRYRLCPNWKWKWQNSTYGTELNNNWQKIIQKRLFNALYLLHCLYGNRKSVARSPRGNNPISQRCPTHSTKDPQIGILLFHNEKEGHYGGIEIWGMLVILNKDWLSINIFNPNSEHLIIHNEE